MNRHVSFVRHIDFDTNDRGLALIAADLYADEKRVYAFLTLTNRMNMRANGAVIKIQPFDEMYHPFDEFGVKLTELKLDPGMQGLVQEPLLLPLGTFAFNFSFVSIDYKGMHVEAKKEKKPEEPATETPKIFLGKPNTPAAPSGVSAEGAKPNSAGEEQPAKGTATDAQGLPAEPGAGPSEAHSYDWGDPALTPEETAMVAASQDSDRPNPVPAVARNIKAKVKRIRSFPWWLAILIGVLVFAAVVAMINLSFQWL